MASLHQSHYTPFRKNQHLVEWNELDVDLELGRTNVGWSDRNGTLSAYLRLRIEGSVREAISSFELSMKAQPIAINPFTFMHDGSCADPIGDQNPIGDHNGGVDIGT